MPRRNYSQDRPRPHTYDGAALRRLAEQIAYEAERRRYQPDPTWRTR